MKTRRQFLTAMSAATLTPLLAVRAYAADVIGRGTFQGESRHETTGSVEVTGAPGSFEVQLGADFTFDGAPDPKVALGRDGYDPNTILGPLASNSGAQSYPIPAGLDPADYNEVWIWCERFNVPLGKAILGQ